MVSIPARNPSWHSRTDTPERLEPQHRSHHSFYHPVVRLNNEVVEILALAQLNVKAGVLIDAMDSGRVGAASLLLCALSYRIKQADRYDGGRLE